MQRPCRGPLPGPGGSSANTLWSRSLLLGASACVPCRPPLQYVPEDLLPVYKEKVVPLADIITPNQFEAE